MDTVFHKLGLVDVRFDRYHLFDPNLTRFSMFVSLIFITGVRNRLFCLCFIQMTIMVT